MRPSYIICSCPNIMPQSLYRIVHLAVILSVARYMLFKRAWSLGNTSLELLILLQLLFKLFMALIIDRIHDLTAAHGNT